MIFFKWIPYYLSAAILYSLLIYCFTFLIFKRHVFSLQKYSDSNLSQLDATDLLHRLDVLMDTKQLFLQHKLTLNDVAAAIDEAPRNISQAINQLSGIGFSAWVNNYRLRYASGLLKNQSLKISGVAHESGFNSLTSFNVLFKKKYQMTPAAYRTNNS